METCEKEFNPITLNIVINFDSKNFVASLHAAGLSFAS